MEQWRPVCGYEGRYSVSESGSVFSHITGKVLKPTLNRDGYLCVDLYKEGRVRSLKKVHRLVCEAYHDNPLNLPCVNHKDQIKTNNHKDNVEWCTKQYNTEYSLSKSYKVISPDGEVIEFFNLSKFCRDNNLNKGHMHSLLIGKKLQYKGYMKLEEVYP